MIKKLILTGLVLCALPSSAYAIGRMRTKDTHLDIDSLRIRVLIEESHTTTEVDHVFRNKSKQAAEAAFDFPLPQRATFSGLSIWVNGEEIQGEVVEQMRAKSIYTSITGIQVEEIRKPELRASTRKRPAPIPRPKDPGLLQMHGRLLRLRVAPVPANGFHRVRVRYIEATHIENGQGRYVFPMALEGSSAVKAKRFSCQLRVQSQSRLDRVWSPSHLKQAILKTQRSGHIYQMTVDEKNATLDSDFECRFQFAQKLRPEVQVHCSEQAAQITITPWIPDRFNKAGRDIVFLVDSSKSMWRHLYELRKAFDGFHSFLREQDRFNIISFNLGATVFHPKMQNLKDFRRRDILHYFARQKYMHQADPTVALCALKRILKRSGQRGRGVELILITDAEFSDQPSLIRAMTITAQERRLRCFALELGSSRYPQRPLTQFAEKTGGSCFAGNHNRSLGAAQDLLQTLYSPVLDKPKLSINGITLKNSYPNQLPSSLRSGSSFRIYGRLDKTGEGTIRLSGRLPDGATKTWTVPISLNPDQKLDIDRLYAQSMANSYLDKLSIANLGRRQARALEIMLLKVSLDAQILTPATCLIVLENESLFQQHRVDRQNRDRINLERAAEARRVKKLNEQFRRSKTESNRDTLAQFSPSNEGRKNNWISPPRVSGGGGSGDPTFLLLAIFAVGAAFWRKR